LIDFCRDLPYLCKTMKTAQKIFSVFLAIIFLISSLGFTANKMVCVKSGKTKLSLVNLKDCCPQKKSSPSTIKSHCCDITNTFFNLGDLNNSHNFQSNKNFNSQLIHAIPGYFVSNDHIADQPLFIFADLPPPLSGRQLLSLISILII
jgi:hypothetical protein